MESTPQPRPEEATLRDRMGGFLRNREEDLRSLHNHEASDRFTRFEKRMEGEPDAFKRKELILAECRIFIEKEALFDGYESLNSDDFKNKLEKCAENFFQKYNFSEEEKRNVLALIELHTHIRSEIKDIWDMYKNDKVSLIEHLTGKQFSDTEKQAINAHVEVSLGPVSIIIRGPQEAVGIIRSQEANDEFSSSVPNDKIGGFLAENRTFIFIKTGGRMNQEKLLEHETQHAVNAIYPETIGGNSPEEKCLNRAKDEILASLISHGGTLKKKAKVNEWFLSENGPYNYLGKFRVQNEDFKEKYADHIHGAIDAAFKLLKFYQKDRVIALLIGKALSEWPDFAEHMTEGAKERGKCKDFDELYVVLQDEFPDIAFDIMSDLHELRVANFQGNQEKVNGLLQKITNNSSLEKKYKNQLAALLPKLLERELRHEYSKQPRIEQNSEEKYELHGENKEELEAIKSRIQRKKGKVLEIRATPKAGSKSKFQLHGEGFTREKMKELASAIDAKLKAQKEALERGEEYRDDLADMPREVTDTVKSQLRGLFEINKRQFERKQRRQVQETERINPEQAKSQRTPVNEPTGWWQKTKQDFSEMREAIASGWKFINSRQTWESAHEGARRFAHNTKEWGNMVFQNHAESFKKYPGRSIAFGAGLIPVSVASGILLLGPISFLGIATGGYFAIRGTIAESKKHETFTPETSPTPPPTQEPTAPTGTPPLPEGLTSSANPTLIIPRAEAEGQRIITKNDLNNAIESADNLHSIIEFLNSHEGDIEDIPGVTVYDKSHLVAQIQNAEKLINEIRDYSRDSDKANALLKLVHTNPIKSYPKLKDKILTMYQEKVTDLMRAGGQ